ncbi:Putative universal stress protein [Xylophilus ampelinus]|nr:universal stress protein [Variovorax sp.]VTY40175.1 Putative universal stress protein [Xylophilus ampelinus]
MYQRILVPVDGSETSRRGLDEALRLAAAVGGRVRVLHAIDELSFALAMDGYAGNPGGWLDTLREQGSRLLALAAAQAAKAGVPADTVLRDEFRSPVHQVVNDEARDWGAELIVLGTHGRRGLGRLVMGSSAEQILRTARVPVLLVRSAEEAQPDKATAVDERVVIHQPTGALAFE